MRLIKLFLIVLMYHCLISNSYGQVANDYRSVGSGNWMDVSNWEFFDGTVWGPAGEYPGQNTAANDVSIINGVTIQLNFTIPNPINSVTVGDGVGGIDTLNVTGDSFIDTLLITYDDGGFGDWNNNVMLQFPAGAAVVIIPTGSLDTSPPCSASKIIQIGTVRYATCNSNGTSLFSFTELVNNGGSLSVAPSANTPICDGDTLNLMANPSGTGSGDPGVTYSWTATGPSGYTFSSSLENPTIAGLSPGSYVYSVTIQDTNGVFNTNNVEVLVGAIPNVPISGGDQNACSIASILPLSVVVGVGQTANWYDAPVGGNLLASNTVTYTPMSQGIFYAEAIEVASGCMSTSRVGVTLSIISCNTTVITNRRITFRVKP